jgi:hypothetical protein
MKPISRDVLASTSSKRIEEMTSQSEEIIAYLIVRTNEYANEGVLLEPNGVLCGFCRRDKGNQDLIFSGHVVSICSECFVSLNTPDLEQSVCGQN